MGRFPWVATRKRRAQKSWVAMRSPILVIRSSTSCIIELTTNEIEVCWIVTDKRLIVISWLSKMIFFLDDIIKMPKIMFEVASYDSWNRYRTEGYTWTQLPLKPGKQLILTILAANFFYKT